MEDYVYLENARKTMQAYEHMGKPLCYELGMPQTAIDILMFLANHPAYHSAKDIVEMRGLKANHVSINVDKLVNEGYLERCSDPTDRRKVILRPTDRAEEVIRRVRALQQDFLKKLLDGVSPEMMQSVVTVLELVTKNIEKMQSE